MRAFREDKKDPILFNFPVDELAKVDDFAESMTRQGRNVYFGVACRLHIDGHSLEDCGLLTALWADLDFGQIQEKTAREALAKFVLAPSAIVHSGGGLHPYWLLDQPINLQDGRAPLVKGILRAMAIRLGADIASAEPARILRLPGTLNFNHGDPIPTTLEFANLTKRYSLDAFEHELGPIRIEPEPTKSPVQHNLDVDERVRRAKQWLAKRPPAVENHGGDKDTYSACCGVAIGFDLPEDEAWAVLCDWNTKCMPPWTEHELRRKLQNAIRYHKGGRGDKLGAPGLKVRKASEIPDQPLEFRFGGRILNDSFAMMVGPGNAGKGMIGVDITARETTGDPYPGESKARRPINMIACVTEDNDSWVKARLQAAGADLERISFVEGPEVIRGGLRMPSPMKLDADAGLLVQHARQFDAKMIFLETTLEHIGDREGKVRHNTNTESEVRQALAPIREVCRIVGMFGLGVIHPRKSTAGGIEDAISGSTAFRNVPRGILYVYPDPSDKSPNPVRLLMSQKNNHLRVTPPTLRFRVVAWDNKLNAPCTCIDYQECPHVGRVVWESDLIDSRSVDEIWEEITESRRPRRDLAVQDAEEFLARILQRGSIPPKEVMKLARDEGISEMAVKRAKKSLKVISVKNNEFPAKVIGWRLPKLTDIEGDN